MFLSDRKQWLIGLLVATVPLGAVAGPGDHIHLADGEVEIVPSVRTGFEYHSNVYLRDGGTTENPEDIIGAPFWLMRPAAELKMEGPWLNLSLIGGYGIRAYIDTKPDDEFKVSTLNRYNDFDTTVNAQFLPNRKLGFRISDRFDIQNTPTDLHGDETDAQNVNIVHTGNDLDGGLVIRPGSALDLNLLGTLSFDTYHLPEDYLKAYPDVLDTPDNATFNNRFNFGPIFSTMWRFLPKTSLVGGASVNWIRWHNNLIPAWGGGADAGIGDVIAKPDGSSWRTTLGVRGQLSPKIAAGIEAGYGQMYYNEESVLDYNSTLSTGQEASSYDLELRDVANNAENYARDLTSFREGLLLNAQASWTPVKGQTLTLAYRKDFQDVLFSNYSAFNSFTIKYEGKFISDHLGATGEYGIRQDQYHGEIARGDLGHRLVLGTSWAFTKYLDTSLTGGWNARYCGNAGCTDTANPNITYTQIQYDDGWVQLAATFRY